jgi:hypothetical protein
MVSEPFTVTVRAWSLTAACRKASMLSLAEWGWSGKDDDV